MNAQTAQITPLIQKDDREEIGHIVSLYERCKSMVVNSQQDCQVAADVLSDVKARIRLLDDRRKAITAPLDAAKKSVMDLFRPAADAGADIERELKGKIGAYMTEQERIRREEQAKAEEKARKERERLEARAQAAAESGNVEKAVELELRAATTVAVAPAAESAKIAGASVRYSWSAEVTDIVALCKAIGAGELPPTLVDVKQSELNRIASTWQNNREFPGLRISKKPVVASR